MHKVKEVEPIDSNYCIALQPICDANMTHIADELLYRSNATATFAQIDDDLMATARVINATFLETGLKNLIGDRKLFFNAPKEWILRPELLPPHPEQVVIEVLESVTGEPEIIAALKEMRALGYDVALDDFVLNDATRPLLEVASIIKVDLLEPVIEADIAEYKRLGMRLLAEKVEDLSTFNRLKAMGFEMFQGYFYARPEVHKETSRKGRANNHNAQIRILSELQLNEPDYQRLENFIAQDPQLAYMLLKYVNSATFFLRHEITTIQQTLNMLGLNRLRSIVTTLMLANNGPPSRLLLPQALTRASMCEYLAQENNNIDPRSAFMMGLISMMDALMGMDMLDLMAQLPLSLEIKDAIMLGEGHLGELLNLVIAFEQAQLNSEASELIVRLNKVWLLSQQWSNEVMSQID